VNCVCLQYSQVGFFAEHCVKQTPRGRRNSLVFIPHVGPSVGHEMMKGGYNHSKYTMNGSMNIVTHGQIIRL
jgi:hypothetical protein